MDLTFLHLKALPTSLKRVCYVKCCVATRNTIFLLDVFLLLNFSYMALKNTLCFLHQKMLQAIEFLM